MNRRRMLQTALSVALVLFLALVAFRFRPKMEGPRPVALPTGGAGVSAVLQTTGFRHVQETDGKTSFVLTAETMTERPGQGRELKSPRLAIPGPSGETVLQGDEGLFEPATRTLRVFGHGLLTRPDGWVAEASGFRMTPEGELLAESAATLRRPGLTGKADLLRYSRDSEKAALEGAVRFDTNEAMACTCSRLLLDLATHSGTLVGPVVFTGPQGRVTSPEGRLILDEENALREVILTAPVRGEGPMGHFSATEMVLELSGRQISRIVLTGVVRAETSGEGSVLETARLHLLPQNEGRWRWEGPQPLTLFRGKDFLKAPSGQGGFGGGQADRADLAGPVTGDGPSGRWRADRASLVGATQVFEGDVRGVRPGERLEADRVELRPDGSRVATGRARGVKNRSGEETLRFVANRAVSAPGGYPVALEGAVHIVRGEASVAAPTAVISDERTARASGGATAVFLGSQGQETLTAPDILYEGAHSRAKASGGAKGVARGYTLTAREVEALLDVEGRPERYLATGKAHLDGPGHLADGEAFEWIPSREFGKATSQTARAWVVLKEPYRRAEGPVVTFEGDRVTVLGGEGGRRGYLETTPPTGRTDGR